MYKRTRSILEAKKSHSASVVDEKKERKKEKEKKRYPCASFLFVLQLKKLWRMRGKGGNIIRDGNSNPHLAESDTPFAIINFTQDRNNKQKSRSREFFFNTYKYVYCISFQFPALLVLLL